MDFACNDCIPKWFSIVIHVVQLNEPAVKFSKIHPLDR